MVLAHLSANSIIRPMPDGPDTDSIIVAPGFAPGERMRAAALFWQAFESKLTPLLAPEDRALSFLSGALCPEHAITARAADGRILGLAGCKTGQCGLFGGGMAELAAAYGRAGALWRGGFLRLQERRPAPGTMMIDGIFVDEKARGRGVGSALIDAVKDRARREGLHSVRLDVVEHNTRARALYERHGFVAGNVRRAGPLRAVHGYRSRTEMRCTL